MNLNPSSRSGALAVGLLLTFAVPSLRAQTNTPVESRADFRNRIYLDTPTHAPTTSLLQAPAVALFSGSIGSPGDTNPGNDGQIFLRRSAIGTGIGGGSTGFKTFGPPTVLVNGESSASGQFTFIGTNSVQVQLLLSFPGGLVDYCLDCATPLLGNEKPAPRVFTNTVDGSSNVTVTLRAVAYGNINAPGIEAPPITVTFIPLFTLEVTNTGGGGSFIATVSPGASIDTNGGRLRIVGTNTSAVTLQAQADPGWTFLYWTNGATGTNPLLNVTLDRSLSAQAVFGTPLFTSLNTNGVIERAPDAPFYPYAGTVRLTAIPTNTAWYFREWRSNALDQLVSPLDFNITNASPVVYAQFAKLPSGYFSLNVRVNGDGTVTRDPALANYPAGSNVTLFAIRGPGQLFRYWSGDASGTNNPLTLVMDTNKSITANFAPGDPTNPPPTVVFSLATNGYILSESDHSVTVTIVKSEGSPAARVNFFTRDGTARAGQDYAATNAILVFAEGIFSRTVTILIADDSVVELPQYFQALISALDPGVAVTNDTTTITIVDNDGSTNSFLTRGVTPLIDPATLPTLQVNLQPTNTGQWRFTWEFNWRNGGSVVSGLPAGDYAIEFKPVSGYIEPLPAVVSLTISAQFTYYYTNTSLPQLGSLAVELDPPFIATNASTNFHGGWRLEGESESSYRDSGARLDGLIAGSHTVYFRTVTNLWTTPSPRVVSVPANRLTTITAHYSVAPLSNPTRPLVPQSFSDVNTTFADGYPYGYCGQLQSEVGFGSGSAVKERVVLTAGHVVFDDESLSFVSGVNWFFQRHAGVYEPPPHTARGSVSLSGYAAARTNDLLDGGTPGISDVASKNRDVAALYFLSPAAGGGFSGYIVSRTPAGEWLFNSSSETLVGYPVEIVPEENRGRMHATAIGRLTWNAEVNSETNQVFYTTNVAGYPGMSGGPLCVQVSTNGANTYYPAAVFLGGSARTTVRVIDGEVVELINLAESLGDSSENNTGGEPPRPACETCPPTGIYAYLDVYLQPATIGSLGGGYTFRNGTPGLVHRDTYARYRVLGNTKVRLDFLGPNALFLAPNSITNTVPTGRTNTVVAAFRGWGQMSFDGQNFNVLGSIGATYRLDVKSNLSASAWTPVRTQTLTSSSLMVSNLAPGAANLFIRAVLLPR